MVESILGWADELVEQQREKMESDPIIFLFSLPFSPEELARLSPYAVEFRYHDIDIALMTREQAETMVNTVLAWAEQTLEAASAGHGGSEKESAS